MTYGTWESYEDARVVRDSDAKGMIGLREDDIRRCTRCLVMWHLSTPTALGNFKINHLLNDRYFDAHELRPSPLTLSIFSVFDSLLGVNPEGG